MSLNQRPFSVSDFIRSLDVIPFSFVQGNQFDLLQAATVRPTSGGVAEIDAMHAGFDSMFFQSPPSGDDGGGKELLELLQHVKISPQADAIGASYSSTTTSGHVGVNLAGLLGGSAHAGTAAVEATCYSLTNVELHSLQRSPLLVPFLMKHLPTFAMNIGEISTIFKQEPTIFSGSVDMVVAVVTTKLTGTFGIYSEKTQVNSGEMEVPAVGPTSGTSVAASANQSSSHKDQQNDRSGILGASFYLSHLHKSVSSGGVKALNATVVQSADDPALTAFCRKIKLKEFRKLVAGRNQASLGLLTEKESDMGSHESLESHLQAAQETVTASASLAVGGWDDNTGVVNLEIAGTNTVPLDDSARLREGQDLRTHYPGNLNLIFSASRNDLSSMYENLKNNIPVDVAGMRVKAMSPAFEVDTSDYLPICVLGKGEEEDEDEIPGSVVRDFIGNFVFIFPVEGHETKRGCATVYSDWEVRESIVRVGADEQGKIPELKEAGFYEIAYEQGSDTRDGEIVMARHQLAREGEPFDGEPSDGDVDILRARAPNDASAVVAAASSVPTLMTSTAGTTEESPKRKKTKLQSDH